MEKPSLPGRGQCPDCIHCQMCSVTRCRICRKGDHAAGAPQPGVGLTHGAYLKWKRERDDAHGSGSVE